jgi:outer membrane protein assembly factor BamE (lipoprotein component of BamABCDE complex)
MRTLLAGLMMAGLAAGCVSSGTKVTQAQLSALVPGETTEAQVIAAYGPPTSVSYLADGTKSDVYLHSAAHATAASYVPVVGLFAGGAKGSTDMAVLLFDKNGVLKSTSSTAAQTDVHTGLANQQ